MATIVARSGRDGRRVWQVLVRRRGHPQRTKTFNTKAEAAAWAATLESEIARGVFVDRSRSDDTLLADLLARYAREITPSKRSAATEALRITSLIRDPIARYSISALTGEGISEYRDRRLALAKPATVNRELNIVSHVLTVAMKEWRYHLPAGNPVALIRRPKVADRRERRLLPGEEDRIVAAAHAYGSSIASIVVLAIESAMRRGEISDMRWEHVDLKKHVLLIPESKNGESRRVPLSTKAMQVLEDLPRNIDGRVWGGIAPESISQAFERARDRARAEYERETSKPDKTYLKDLRFHDLRHEATSRLFEKGLNPMQVAAITGHKTLQMLKRYTHLRAEDLVGMLG